MYKITVHTPHGDVSVGDKCDGYRNGEKKFTGTWEEVSKPNFPDIYGIIIIDGSFEIKKWVDSIRPIQKPKPLEGLELAEKLCDLMRLGWWWISEGNKDRQICNTSISFNKDGHEIRIGNIRHTLCELRPPRSTEWIRACDVTEETGI